MPQVHSKSFPQEGTGVRFLASISLSESGMRSVRMKNHVEGNLQKIKSRRLETLASKSDRTEHKQRLKLRQSLRPMVAYRQVIEERSVARKGDYCQSLNWNYTEEGMKSDIDRVLYDTDPATIQRKKERVTVENNRQKYREILKQSRDNLSQIFLARRDLQQSNESEYLEKSAMDTFLDKKDRHSKTIKREALGSSSFAIKQPNSQLCNFGSSRNISSPIKYFLHDGNINGVMSREEDACNGLPPSVLNNLLKLRQIMLPPIGVNFAKKYTFSTPGIQDKHSKTIMNDTKSVQRLSMKKGCNEDLDQNNCASKFHNAYKRSGKAAFRLPPVQVTKALLI